MGKAAGGKKAGPCGLLRLGFGERREGWAAGQAGCWVLVMGSFSISFSFLFLLQTKFEFKYKFEFKPHSNKNMHQHECINKVKPKKNFNHLRNKN